MKKEPLFIDTNFFCASFNPKDSLNSKANNLVEDLNNYDLYTSNFVLLETYTVLSQNAGRQKAFNFNNYIKTTKKISVILCDKNIESETWEIFEETKTKDLSYVDCSNIAAMQAYNIKTLLSFDKHFAPLQKLYRFKLIS